MQCRIFHRDGTSDSGKIPVNQKASDLDCYVLDPPLQSAILFLFG